MSLDEATTDLIRMGSAGNRAVAVSSQLGVKRRLLAAHDERVMAAYAIEDPERRSARLRFLGVIPPKPSAVEIFLSSRHDNEGTNK